MSLHSALVRDTGIWGQALPSAEKSRVPESLEEFSEECQILAWLGEWKNPKGITDPLYWNLSHLEGGGRRNRYACKKLRTSKREIFHKHQIKGKTWLKTLEVVTCFCVTAHPKLQLWKAAGDERNVLLPASGVPSYSWNCCSRSLWISGRPSVDLSLPVGASPVARQAAWLLPSSPSPSPSGRAVLICCWAGTSVLLGLLPLSLPPF